MSTATQFFGDRVWTPDDIDEAIGEDEDWARYEIVDGVLIVSPHAVVRHQMIATALVQTLRAATPSDCVAVGSLGVRLGRSYRVTDATVVRRSVAESDPGILDPGDVLLVAEVESPSSVTTDRITKPAQYAAAGIAHYWRVETEPLRLVSYRLVGDVYEQAGAWNANETAGITDPFDVTIDLATLLP